MKSTIYYFIACTLCFLACQPTTNTEAAEYAEEINQLTTLAAKKAYLENLFEDDQRMRRSTEDSDIMLKYGIDSKEYRAYAQKIIDQDAINLAKIEQYLAVHGHPTLADFGKIATCTPSVVVHHAQTYEERERNFDTFYQAFLDGNLDEGGLSMLLGRMYYIKFGERFRMKSPFQSIDEINQLIKLLDLEEKVQKITAQKV